MTNDFNFFFSSNPGNAVVRPHKPALPAAEPESDFERYLRGMERHPRYQDHLFLGWNALSRKPFFLHKSLLQEHGVLLGGTGAGKTSLGLLPLLIQLIRHQLWDPQAGAFRPGAAVVVIDCKGDDALFHSCRLEAERSGRKFRFFTNELCKTTYGYSPLRHLHAADRSYPEVAQGFMDAVGLNHGQGYGRSYYTRRGLRLLNATFQAHQMIRILSELAMACYAMADEREREATYELLSVLESLACIEQMNYDGDDGIDVRRALREKEVLYFYLPARKESQTVNMIAKLVLFDLFQAADPNYPCFVVIDEFARCIGETLTIILEQSRSLGLSLLLSTQTFSGLKSHDCDLLETVWSNTHFRHIFDVPHPDTADFLLQALGRYTVLPKTATLQNTVPLLPEEPPYFHEINSDPLRAIVSVTRDHGLTCGYGRPVLLAMQHCLRLAEYQRRKEMPWPEVGDCPGAFLARKASPPPALPDPAYAPRRPRRGSAKPALLAVAEGPTPEFTEGLRRLLDKTQNRTPPKETNE